MTDNVIKFGRPQPPYFHELWDRLAVAAAEAVSSKDKAKHADVITTGAMVLANALVILGKGDRTTVDGLLKATISALEGSVDDVMAVNEEAPPMTDS
jgi:hypothetical protein